MKRVLAAASAGGHWEQLMLLRSAFGQNEVCFVTTDKSMAEFHGITDAVAIIDCNKSKPIHALICLAQAIAVALRERPDVVISTGAAPGLFCALAGRLLGAKVLWIDSLANAEQLSMCGSLSRFISHETLTQWEHLADAHRVTHAGSVL